MVVMMAGAGPTLCLLSTHLWCFSFAVTHLTYLRDNHWPSINIRYYLMIDVLSSDPEQRPFVSHIHG